MPDPAVAAAPVPQLTARQRQVLDLVAAGTTSNKELAKELFISEKTVKSHIERITASLDVSRRTQLPLRAVELGLLPAAGREPARLTLTRTAAATGGRAPDRQADQHHPWSYPQASPVPPASTGVGNSRGASQL